MPSQPLKETQLSTVQRFYVNNQFLTGAKPFDSWTVNIEACLLLSMAPTHAAVFDHARFHRREYHSRVLKFDATSPVGPLPGGFSQVVCISVTHWAFELKSEALGQH